MKDITLKIIGKLSNQGEDQEQMQFITEGKIYTEDDAVYLIYDESLQLGEDCGKTTLKMTKDYIRMRRGQKEEFYDTEMVFEKGKRYTGKYNTAYGELDIEVLTRDIINDISEENGGSITIDYQVSLGGIAEGRNLLNIQVM